MILWNRSIGDNAKWIKRVRYFQKMPGITEYRVLNITQIITDGADCYPWREVYAWLPVKTITGKYVWRQKVFKRKVWIVWGTGFHMEPEVHYATAFDLLEDPYESLGR